MLFEEGRVANPDHWVVGLEEEELLDPVFAELLHSFRVEISIENSSVTIWGERELTRFSAEKPSPAIDQGEQRLGDKVNI